MNESEKIARLRGAIEAFLAHRDRHGTKPEEFVRTPELPQGYWSPAGIMVDSEYIAGLRAALCDTEDPCS